MKLVAGRSSSNSSMAQLVKFSLAALFVAITFHTTTPVVATTSAQVTTAVLKNGTVVRVRRVIPIMFSNHRSMEYVGVVNLTNFTSGDNAGGLPSVSVGGTVLVCSESIEDFPSFFTEEQRLHGAIVVPFVIAVYCFTIIAIICDNYFLPCVERICEALNLTQDVAAATFMAMATSAPELFANIIGTFVTESDIGIGTVVGSSMFNTLGVAAIGGLAATAPIQMDWWPLTRDCAIYICSIVLLVWITWDGQIFWYEAFVLFLVYFIYLTVMFQNVRISNFFRKSLHRLWSRKISAEPIKPAMELDGSVMTIDDELNKYIEHKEQQKDKQGGQRERRLDNGQTTAITITEKTPPSATGASTEQHVDNDDEEESLFRFPSGHWTAKLWFVYTWPIKFLLFCTVPDCRRHRRVFPITFLMCVIWIALNSYLVSWMVTIIGSTFGIQDSVLGLTFLAAGGCLPEAISITITSRKGEGRMGVSNALGANTMNILLSLGLPWFIKSLILVARDGGDEASIKIVSGSLEYTILALIIVALTLYLCLTWNKFRLSRKSGAVLILLYLFFLVGAILSELYLFETEECAKVLS